MGNTYEVWRWGNDIDDTGYRYIKEYEGEFIFRAISTMIKLKINGAGCVKFEWR